MHFFRCRETIPKTCLRLAVKIHIAMPKTSSEFAGTFEGQGTGDKQLEPVVCPINTGRIGRFTIVTLVD